MGTVLLSGGFGNGNPAEEAVLSAFIAALPDARVIAASHDPAATRALHGCGAVRAGDPVAIARTALRADATVLCGRGVFGAPPPFGGRWPSRRLAASLALLLTARARNRPRAVVGATVDPLRTPLSRRLARGLVRWSELLVLRDEESAEALAAAGAVPPFRIGADPAWTVVAPGREASAGNGGDPARRRERIAVALGPPAAGTRTLEPLAAALERVRAAGHEVVLQPWQTRSRRRHDGHLARFLADRLDPSPPIAEPPADLPAARETLAGFGLVIALRYHALIAAASAGVPSLTMEDRPEMVGLARRLGQPVVGAGAGPEELAEAITAALDHSPPGEAAVRAQVAAAEEGFRLLRLLISGGQIAEAERISGLRLDAGTRA